LCPSPVAQAGTATSAAAIRDLGKGSVELSQLSIAADQP
jgi:hypothetical protein